MIRPDISGDSAGLETRLAPPIKLPSPAETAARHETLARDLAETTRQLAEAREELARLREGAPFSPADLDRMDAESDDAIMLDDLRDNFEAIVEGSYRIDCRAEDEGFGKELDAELIVNVRIPESFAFTATVAAPGYRASDCVEREFVARRLETGEADVVRYSVGLK